MEDDSSTRGVVIKGPWKKVVEQKIDKDINVREDLKMIADMHKVLLHQLKLPFRYPNAFLMLIHQFPLYI